MKLEDYLIEKNLSKADFAKKIGRTREYIHNLLKGHYYPSLASAKKIEEITSGKVKVEDLRPPKKERITLDLVYKEIITLKKVIGFILKSKTKSNKNLKKELANLHINQFLNGNVNIEKEK